MPAEPAAADPPPADDTPAAPPTVYLDLCCLQRPYDDQSQPRVAAESAAVLAILAACESGRAAGVSSGALWMEAGRNPVPAVRAELDEILSRAAVFAPFDRDAGRLAASYRDAGMRAVDTIHLGCAVAAGVDTFCTVDDKFLRRARRSDTRSTVIRRPEEWSIRLTPPPPAA